MLYFAVLRERAGTDAESLVVPDGATARMVLHRRFPEYPDSVGFAINQALCPPDTVLYEGDELALLPPVGGG